MQFEVKKEWRQVKDGIKKGHNIGIVEKAQETSSDSDMHNTVLVPLLYILHEQWMCLGMQRNTHIMGNNLIPIFIFYSNMTLYFRLQQTLKK